MVYQYVRAPGLATNATLDSVRACVRACVRAKVKYMYAPRCPPRPQQCLGEGGGRGRDGFGFVIVLH